MWGIIVALISGALMSVQGVFNTGVTKQTSTWLASAWVAFSGFIVAIALQNIPVVKFFLYFFKIITCQHLPHLSFRLAFLFGLRQRRKDRSPIQEEQKNTKM